jgi:type VI secretion system ImpJ/VasE family protein
MPSNLDVLWVEGSLLTAHHLQASSLRQQEVLDERLRVLPVRTWGVISVDLDEPALESGKVIIRHIHVVMRDGTVLKHTAPISRALSNVRAASTSVYVSLPSRGRGSEVDPGPGIQPRYDVVSTPVADRHGDGGTRTLQLGRLAPIAQVDDDPSEGFERLEIARVERVSGEAWRVRPDHVPRVLRADASKTLRGMVEGVLGALQARRRRVLAEVAGIGIDALARSNPIALWLSHSLGGAIARLRHAVSVPHASPEDWFAELSHTAGELCTFHQGEDPSMLPTLRGDDLFGSYQRLCENITRLLDVKPPARFTEIHMNREGAVWSGELPEIDNMRSATMLILLYTQDGRPITHNTIEAIKVGAPDRVSSYAQLGLPGVSLRLLDAPPAAAPRREGARYTSVRTRSPRWKECEEAGAVALHAPRAVGLSRVEAVIVHPSGTT